METQSHVAYFPKRQVYAKEVLPTPSALAGHWRGVVVPVPLNHDPVNHFKRSCTENSFSLNDVPIWLLLALHLKFADLRKVGARSDSG